MHDELDQYGHCQGENIGSREKYVKPFSLDANQGIEGAREYEYGSCNSQGWRDFRMYG